MVALRGAVGEAPLNFQSLVEQVMASGQSGVVLLLEVLPSWPLQLQWLDHQVQMLSPGSIRCSVGESVLAVLQVGTGLADGWRLKEELLARAGHTHLGVLCGMSSWPVHGATPMDVLAAAAASLEDERTLHSRLITEELELDVDGVQLALGVAGDFLTG